MSHPFDPQSIIAIPARSADDVAALANRLLRVAADSPLAASFAEPLGDLRTTTAGLEAQIGLRGGAHLFDSRFAKDADAHLDASWSAFRDWVGAWRKHGGLDPALETMRALDAHLFPSGLSFLTERYDAQWGASRWRIEELRGGRYADAVRELGGVRLLDALFAAHEAYGRAIGTTGEPPAAAEVNLRAARDEVFASMREYVVAVAATVRRRRPETLEAAEALLRPLLEARVKNATAPRPEGTPDPLAG